MVTITALAVELRLREPVNDSKTKSWFPDIWMIWIFAIEPINDAVDSSQQDRASLIVEHDHHRGLEVK